MKRFALGILLLLASLTVQAAGNWRDQMTIGWDYTGGNDRVDLFKLYSRTNFPGVTLIETNFPYTFALASDMRPPNWQADTNSQGWLGWAGDGGWTVFKTFKPSDLTLTNMTTARLDGTLYVRTNVYVYTITNLVAGPMFFVMTASNIWGESVFSEVLSFPKVPSDSNRNLQAR